MLSVKPALDCDVLRMSFIRRVVRRIADGRMRMYLHAVTDPATGLVDADLERSALRSMTL